MSDAADLATLFFEWSGLVDDHLEKSAASLTEDQQSDLKKAANQLDSAATHFTLAEVDESIASAEGAIEQLKTVTAHAKQALKHLQTIEQTTQILIAVGALGKCAASGNLAGLVGAIGDLTKAITPASTGGAQG